MKGWTVLMLPSDNLTTFGGGRVCYIDSYISLMAITTQMITMAIDYYYRCLLNKQKLCFYGLPVSGVVSMNN